MLEVQSFKHMTFSTGLSYVLDKPYAIKRPNIVSIRAGGSVI